MPKYNLVNNAFQFEQEQRMMKGLININLSNKNVYAGQNSLVHPAISTAGAYGLNGAIIDVAATSTMFALEQTTIPAYGGAAFVCCLNAASSGIGYATNVLTSAQMSSASAANKGAACANLIASDDIEWPTIPDTMTPIAIYAVAAGDSAHVAGSETFSAATSNGASHAYTQIMNLNRIS